MTLTQIKPAGLSKPVDLADDEKIRLGTGNDLQIYHGSAGGGSSFIDTAGSLQIHTSELYINNEANTERMIRGVQNGTTELYYDGVLKLDTTASAVRCNDNLIMGTHHIELNDNSQIMLGNAPDMRIYHDGNSSFITNTTGDLVLVDESRIALRTDQFVLNNHANNESIIYAAADGEVSLYHNNVKRFDTTGSGVEVFGILQMDDANSHIKLVDNARIDIGNGNDLQLYHASNESYIIGNTNQLYVRSNQGIYIQPAGNENGVVVLPNAASELYYDNVKKFETTANGVKVNNRFEMRNGVIFDNTANGNNCGLSFNGDSVRPTSGSGADIDNARDLGISSVRWNDLWLGGSANIGNYIRTNYNNNGGGAHMYFKNNSQGANFSSHFQTYASSNEGGTTQTHIHYYHGGYCELLHQGNSSVRTRSGGGVLFRNGGTTIGTFDPDGLKFGTDTAEVNALDDYEEGTWTPAFYSFTNVGSSEVRQKLYTKIGNTVHLWLELFGDNDIGWTDNAYIAGTPFSGSSYFPTSLYIPVVIDVMYGGPNYSMDQTAAGRAYYSGYSDKIYLKMGTFANVRHIWLQLTYRTNA